MLAPVDPQPRFLHGGHTGPYQSPYIARPSSKLAHKVGTDPRVAGMVETARLGTHETHTNSSEINKKSKIEAPQHSDGTPLGATHALPER